MFETGIRQLRLAIAMTSGRPINPRMIEKLIGDALATLTEFGSPGADAGQLIDGPFADPAARADFQTRALRRTARRLAALSPFYTERFAQAGLDPRALTLDGLHQIPVTTKADLLTRPNDLLSRGSKPYLSTRTTGSTGNPAQIWLSRYEAELWPAMAALSGLLRGEISPTDSMQINISSRATAAVQQNITVCRLVGAQARVLGIVPPDDSLDHLLAGSMPPTLLATYPSYLAELVTAAGRRGLNPADFHLRRIDVGGEVLSPALTRAAQLTFGGPTINDTFAMTEVLPVSGRTCRSGHLHHDLNMGLVEIIDPTSGAPAGPGRVGTAVITPFYPYRECMPVLRYDTRDLVREPDSPLTCELAAVPGTSPILGKAEPPTHSARPAVPVRDLIEVIEALPSRPWPARFTATPGSDGSVQLTVPATAVAGLGPQDVLDRFAARGISITLRQLDCDRAAARRLRTVRSDLTETTLTTGRN